MTVTFQQSPQSQARRSVRDNVDSSGSARVPRYLSQQRDESEADASAEAGADIQPVRTQAANESRQLVSSLERANPDVTGMDQAGVGPRDDQQAAPATAAAIPAASADESMSLAQESPDTSDTGSAEAAADVAQPPDGEEAANDNSADAAAGEQSAQQEEAPAASAASSGPVFDDLSISAADVGIPRLGIRTPRVASPPRPSIERSEDIRKRTGSPPELHHAQVRQSVERVADTARGAQRCVVTDIGHLASQTRLTMEDMADEIPGVVAAAVAFIQHTVDQKQMEVDLFAERQAAHIAEHGVRTGEEAEAARDEVAMEMYQRLMADSDEVAAAFPVLAGRFDHYAGLATPLIKKLPSAGVAPLLPMPPPCEGQQPKTRDSASGSDNEPANEREGSTDGETDAESGGESEGPKTPAYAMFSLVGSLVDMATGAPITETSDEALDIGNGPNLAAYKISRGWQINVGRFEIKDREIRERQNETADESVSPGNLSRFSMMALGLTAPLAERNQSRPLPEVQEQGGEPQQRVMEQQVAEAQDVLYDRSERAGRKLQEDIAPTLKKNIRKTGRKIRRAFRKQALATERALNKARVSMADAYRDLVQRLRPMLPQDRFLDARALKPKLDAARQSVMDLYSGQIDDAETQAADAIDKTRKAQRDRTDDIWKAARKSLGTVDDAVTRTQFSFAQYAGEKTGVLSDDGIAVMGEAAKFAEKIAGALTGRNEKLKCEGFQQVNRAAVSFFNGYLAGAQTYQYRALKNYVDEMTAIPQGPFYQEYSSIEKLLNGRADDVDNALPSRSLLAAGGLTLASPIAAGVYLYHTDADEDEVIKALGDLPLMAGPAIQDVWTEKGFDDTMRERIRDCMSNPEERHALGLISGDPGLAGTARLDIARESTKYYGFNLSYDRDARESALRGLTRSQRDAAEALHPGAIADTRESLQDGLWSHQEDISTAYLDDNRERAVAAMARERMADARSSIEFAYWPGYEERIRRESDAAVIAATENIDQDLQRELQVESAFTVPSEFNRSRDQVFREYVALENPRRPPSSASGEEARQVFLQYITDDRNTYVVNAPLLMSFGIPGVLNPVTAAAVVDPTPMSMDPKANALVTAIVNKGPNSPEVIAPRMAYEIHRAQTEGGDLSEDTQSRLTNAIENRAYFNLQRDVQALPEGSPERAAKEAELLIVEQAHQQRMLEVARSLGAPAENLASAEAATTWLSDEVGRQFARTHSVHRRYGRELVSEGRASLVAGVELATRGGGTHEDLLRSTYQDRTRGEISDANAEWARDHDGEDMEVMLGIKERPRDDLDRAVDLATPFAPGVAVASWMIRSPETSGDLAMELTRLARGNPENDRDRVELAALRANQEREQGTGFIARQSMRGTPEAETLDGRRRDLARLMLASARGNESLNDEDREWLARAESNPAAVFGPDGRINGRLNRLAFDQSGDFRGDRLAFNLLTDRTTFAADSYRAEIDRQEAMLTSAITWLAIAVSVVLMVVPGVNVVAAGILTALIAGSATMLAKYGMRGERYGWEEAATDLAMMGIEAATAGIGGAMVGELGSSLLVRPMLKLGNALGRLGKVGGAAARESITGAIASAAQIAAQDETWSKGPDAALDRIISGGVRGAAVAAVTAAASESVSLGLQRKMNLGTADDALASPLRRAAPRMGRNTSEMIQEGVSEAVGAVAGEATALIFEISSGEYKGGLKGALERMGAAGLRDMMSGVGRTAARQHNTRRYRSLLSAARRSGKVSDADLRALHLAGISAGDIKYGDGVASARAELAEWGRMADRIPSLLRDQVDGFDVQTLRRLAQVLDGDGVTPKDRAEFYRSIHDKYGDIDIRQLRQEVIGAGEQRRADDATRDRELQQQKRLRNDLIGGVRGPARRALRAMPVDGLDALTPAEVKRVADMIRNGQLESNQVDALLTAAKGRDAALDTDALRQSLDRAVAMSREAQDIEVAAKAKARSDLLEAVPADAQGIVGRLPDSTVGRIQKLIGDGSAGSRQQQDSLFAAARRDNPELNRDQFRAFLEDAAAASRQQKQVAKDIAREQRKERMSNVPADDRGVLSVLPDHLLIELRVLQSQGGEISPAERLRFLEAARRQSPDIDIESFNDSLGRALKVGPEQRISGRQAREMRKQLTAAIPRDQRRLLDDVPILTVSDADFEAFTRSKTGQAVTIIIHGRPVVVIREGADPSSLREEGIHALQIKDPEWIGHVGALSEEELEHWDEMSIEQQIVAYNSKLALEIDAQQRLLASLDVPDSDGRIQRDLVQSALDNLQRRAREVGEIGPTDIRRMEVGLLSRPQWLDQAARLFNKVKPSESEIIARLSSDLKSDRQIRADLKDLAIEELRAVHALGLDPSTARRAARHIAASSDRSTGLAALRTVSDALPPAIREEAMSRILGQGDRSESMRLIADVVRAADSASQSRIAALALESSVLDVLRAGAKLDADSILKVLQITAEPDLAIRALRIAGKAADGTRFVDDLNDTLSKLPEKQRTETLDALLRNTGDVHTIGAALKTLADIGVSPKQRGELVKSLLATLKGIDSPGDRAKILRLVDELPQSAQRVGIDEAEAADLLTGVLDTAGEQHERFVLIESTLKLMDTVAARIESAAADSGELKEARTVLDFLRAKLTGTPLAGFNIKPANPTPSGDSTAELRHLGSDIRAAARALGDPADPAMIKALAEGILADGRMAGSDGWEIELQQAMLNWPGFAKGSKAQRNFADLLTRARPNMDERQRAMLAELQPWFDHFMAKMHPDADAELRMKELERFIGYGQKQGTDLSSQGYDTIMKEIRRDAAGSEAEFGDMKEIRGDAAGEKGVFDDEKELRLEMSRIGISEKEIDQRLGGGGHALRLEDLAAGRVSLEDHLRGLIQQREEARVTIEIAKMLGLPLSGFKQRLTEVKGELAATLEIMRHPRFADFELVRGFEAGTGFDQVWVRREGGVIREVVVVEAKGPRATVGSTGTKGKQMSAQWVARTVIEMLAAGDINNHQMVSAIENDQIKVLGVVATASEDGESATIKSAADNVEESGEEFPAYDPDELKRWLETEPWPERTKQLFK